MIKNIYAPLSGGVAQEKLLELIANNLANVNTTGYKEEQVSFRALEADPWPSYSTSLPPAPFKLDMNDIFPLHGNEMSYAAIAEVKTDFSTGPLKSTGNPLDVAIKGDGFFVTQTPFGERLTRNGHFQLTPEGSLVTSSGNPIMGERGLITGLKESTFRILPSGEVYDGDKFIDNIQLISVKDTSLLEKIGDSFYVYNGSPDTIVKSQSQLEQGSLEGSNVNPMKNLSAMIVAHRTYEAMQKAIKAHDESMQTANQKVATLQN